MVLRVAAPLSWRQTRRALWHRITSVPALLFGFFVATYALTSAGSLDAVDGIVIADTARALVERHTLALTRSYSGVVVGVGGHLYSKYGIGLSIVEMPFDMAGLALRHVTHREQMVTGALSLTNTFVTALCCVTFFLVVRRLGASERRGIALTLLYGLCTLAWTYAKTDFTEPLQTLTLLVAAYAALRASDERAMRWIWVSGAALGAAVLTRPPLLVVMPALALYVAASDLLAADGRWTFGALREARWWRGALYKQVALWAPVAVAIGVTLWLDLVRFGSAFDLGYGRTPGDANFSGSVLTGLFGLLLSFNSGLIWYATPVVIGLFGLRSFARRRPRELLLVGALALCLLALYSPYRYWAGLATYGPRYLLPLIPFLLLPAVDALPGVWDRPRGHPWALGVVAALALAGLAEALLGISVSFGAYSLLTCVRFPCANSLDASQSELLYDVWLLPSSLAYNLLGHAPHVVLNHYPFGAAPPGRPGWQAGLLGRMKYFWFTFLPHPRAALAGGVAICGGLAIACCTALLRRVISSSTRAPHAAAPVGGKPAARFHATRVMDGATD